MRFWDASALVPLCCTQPASRIVDPLMEVDDALVVWWGTLVECSSALARVEREASLVGTDLELARRRLSLLAERWSEVLGSESLRSRALQLLRLHPLRAADALQLAAALTWAEGWAGPAHFVCLDERLRDAAAREGLDLLP